MVFEFIKDFRRGPDRPSGPYPVETLIGRVVKVYEDRVEVYQYQTDREPVGELEYWPGAGVDFSRKARENMNVCKYIDGMLRVWGGKQFVVQRLSRGQVEVILRHEY